MTTMSARIPGGATHRAGHFGAWRALTAVPAIIGSLLLLVLFGWLGSWEPLVLLAWLASGAAVFTRVGERVAVRVGCGFRRPSVQQLAMLEPTWVAALDRCGLAPGDLDLYVQRSEEANAYAAGGRSVSVTIGVVQEFRARRLVDEYLLGILCHELGHHATKAPRFALVTVWLATPWRFAARVVIGIGLATVGRRQPLRLHLPAAILPECCTSVLIHDLTGVAPRDSPPHP
ncbi:MAG: M48 family metalloprotease [Acidimicrobiales bacterium]